MTNNDEWTYYFTSNGNGLGGASNNTQTYIYPNGTTAYPGTTTVPYTITSPNITVMPNNGFGYYQPTVTTTTYAYSYKSMQLPKKRIPKKVYVNGKLLTLGIIGSNVECAYVGAHLIFAPGVTEGLLLSNQRSIVLEYAREVYNYSIEPEELAKNKLNVKLLSIVKSK